MSHIQERSTTSEGASFQGPTLLNSPVVNDLLLGYLLYKSRLVPRVLPVLAFIGAPLLLVADAAVLFGVVERVSALPAIAVLPVALFEFSLGVYLTVKGFRPSPITAGMV
jgi:Domain of unknown function (DUF4386)